MYDITNAAGGEEFCGDELADAESNTFYFEIYTGDSLICDDGGHPIYEGQYGPGADNAMVKHMKCIVRIMAIMIIKNQFLMNKKSKPPGLLFYLINMLY